MIFDTLSAIADYRNNKRFDNNASREQCEAVIKELMIANHETLTIGQKKLLNDESKKWGYWVDGVQDKSTRTDLEPYVSNLESSSSSSMILSSSSFSSSSNSCSSSSSYSSSSYSSSSCSSSSYSSSSLSSSSCSSSSSSNSCSSSSSEWTAPAGVKTWLSGVKSGPISSSGTWADQTTNNANYTLRGSATVTSENGLVLPLPNNASNGAFRASVTLLAASWTLCMWVKQTDYLGIYSALWCWGDRFKSSQGVKDEVQNSDWQIKGATKATLANFTKNSWYHLVWQYTGTKYRYSVNGAAWVDAFTDTAIGGSDTMQIGYSAGNAALYGYIDDVFIADSALSDADITSIRTGSPGKRG